MGFLEGENQAIPDIHQPEFEEYCDYNRIVLRVKPKNCKTDSR
jgi:hypothetical protein